MSKPLLDNLQIEFRALDESKRSASFVAATEKGVMSFRGRQVLRMAGAKLDRYQRNPVVLDTHDRFSIESIVGRAELRVEGKQLVADVFFAETTRGKAAWELVKQGFLRAVSIGFLPDPTSIVEVRQGQFDGEGESRIDGPAQVINRWEPFELSVVPVPADPDALRRHFEELSMSNQTPQPPAAPAAPAIQAPATAAAPVAPVQRSAEPVIQDVPEEKFRRSVVAMAPRAMKPEVVDQIILDANGDLAVARTRMLEENKKLMTPVGTPEPKVEAKPGEQQRGQEPAAAAASAPADDLLVRSLCSPARL